MNSFLVRFEPWSFLSSLALAGGLSGLLLFVVGCESVRARFFAWRATLEVELEFLRAGVRADVVVGVQATVTAVALGLGYFEVKWLALVPLALGLPHFLLLSARRRRVQAIESQVEGWLAMLARALDAAPSLGEAIEASMAMCEAPLRQELEVVISEMHLGASLDEALSHFERRVNGRVLSLALGTLRVGRQTGGRLGEVLRTSAESLREMERLEGLVRTKTAEGRAQAWVIGVIPFPLYGIVSFTDPMYFVPLETTKLGHVVMGIAAALWISAVLSARKILAVRI